MTPSVRSSGTVVQLYTTGSARPKEDTDARRAPRRRLLKAGIVAYNDRHATAPCTVRDISETGVRLRMDSSLGAPDTFELIIELDGLEVDCEVVWRKDNELGARFLSAPRIGTPKRVQVINALTPQKPPSLRRKPRSGEPQG